MAIGHEELEGRAVPDRAALTIRRSDYGYFRFFVNRRPTRPHTVASVSAPVLLSKGKAAPAVESAST